MRRALFPPFAFVSTLFFSSAAVVGGLVGAPPGWFDWVHRGWSRGLLWLAGVRVEGRGLDRVRPDAAQIFVANHQSVLDIWALMAVLPASLRFVAKEELARIPIFGRACRAAGHVFIDRSAAARAGEAIREAGRRMHEEGLSLVLFPEGTRSAGPELGRFRRGSFTLAIETGATLVPVAVDGGGRLLPSGRWAPDSGMMTVTCGDPVPLAGKTSEDRDVLLRRTRESIAAMLTGCEEDRGPR